MKSPAADAWLPRSFFERDVLAVARELVGVELVWGSCAGVIVETEAYAVDDDPACHTATRPSAREFVRTRPAGAAYVYFNYGMYWLFNLHVKGGPRDGLILIRALQPTRGTSHMRRRRPGRRDQELCSGPGRLALALGIAGEHHGLAVAGRGQAKGCGLKRSNVISPEDVVADVRVGISQGADYPWRFLAAGNPHVSVPPGRVKAHKSARAQGTT